MDYASAQEYLRLAMWEKRAELIHAAQIQGSEAEIPLHPWQDPTELGFKSREDAEWRMAAAAAARAALAKLDK